MIGDIPILVAEILAICEALFHAIQEKNTSVIIESNSLIGIQAINGNTLSPFLICNLVEETKNLALEIDNISFHYCRKSSNRMADRIAKEFSHVCTFTCCY